jgi:peptide/nickel transport system permease protein
MALGAVEMAAQVDLRVARRRRRLPSMELVAPATLLALIAAACFLGPALLHIAGPNAGNIGDAFQRIGARGHLLGTDPIGNDELSRCLFGGRTSLEVGVGSVSIGMLIGSTLGIASGYFGGVLDVFIMRALDMLLAFPSLILALVVATYLGPSELHVIYAIAFFTIPSNARITRSTTLKIRGSDYLTAARFAGRRNGAILVEHVVGSAVRPLVTFGLLAVGIAIIVEASLSFLGLGVPPPQPSWGSMISVGQPYLATDPGLVLIPAIFLFVTVLGLNLLGDALRSRWANV